MLSDKQKTVFIKNKNAPLQSKILYLNTFYEFIQSNEQSATALSKIDNVLKNNKLVESKNISFSLIYVQEASLKNYYPAALQLLYLALPSQPDQKVSF